MAPEQEPITVEDARTAVLAATAIGVGYKAADPRANPLSNGVEAFFFGLRVASARPDLAQAFIGLSDKDAFDTPGFIRAVDSGFDAAETDPEATAHKYADFGLSLA